MVEKGPVVVVGAGGHAYPVLELLDALGIEVAGLVDRRLDAPSILGRSVIATIDDIAQLPSRGVWGAVIAIGNNEARLRLADIAQATGLLLPTIVHPTALISPSATLGEGTQVMARSFIGPKAALGRLVLVNTGAIVEHECSIEDGAHIAPGSVLCGAVQVGKSCFVGPGSVVTLGRRIGSGSRLGAGSVLLNDLDPGMTAVGVPARVSIRP